jgi:hypothetical protein
VRIVSPYWQAKATTSDAANSAADRAISPMSWAGSATSMTRCVMSGPTAARQIGGLPNDVSVGRNVGVISVCV